MRRDAVGIVQHGKRRARVRAGALVLAITFIACVVPAGMAGAQTAAPIEDPDLFLELSVGYTTSYRDNSWVPVDVMVTNEEADLTGWVEVRIYGPGEELESPIYRMPAVCPKNSRKRFRFNCYISGATRIEARIYEGNRMAVEFPSYLENPTPIRESDLMGLILAEDETYLGFLIEISDRVEDEIMLPPMVDGIRFHRHQLATDQLSLLPDFAEAYKAFDVIVMEEIDPARVGLKSRELIRNYVMGGGTLVVYTGLNTAAYRGSWVEPLMGVRLGETENTNELAVAESVFPANQRQGAQADRECVFATLEPDAPGVKSLGEERVLATAHSLGQGVVCTLAVDAKSQVLQGTEGFKAMWTQILVEGLGRKELNVEQAGQLTAMQLPSVLGVEIRPLSSVLTYLLLYLGVGVIGNWLFWNWLKRREMAWASLIVISFCFTGYAMMSGTSGWEKTVDLQRIEVVQIFKNSAVADYDAFTGVLTSRTSTFRGALVEEGMLVRDVTQALNTYQFNRGMQRQMGRRPPFYAIQGTESSVDNFRVGARELRLMHVEGQIRLAGGVDGTITIDDELVHGRLRNLTGLTLNRAKLFLDGVFFDLMPEGDGWSVRIPTRQYLNRRAAGEDTGNRNYQNIYYSGQRLDISNFMESLRTSLFTVRDGFESGVLDPDYGAYVVGFADEAVARGFVPDGQVNERITETLVTAPVTVHRSLRNRLAATQLMVEDSQGRWRRSSSEPGNDWNNVQSNSTELGTVSVRLTESVWRSPDADMELDLFTMNQGQGGQLYLSPLGETDRAWHEAHLISGGGNMGVRKRTWGPEQATGAPDTYGAADSPSAWASQNADDGIQWLRVDFERAANIAEVRIRETFNPGAVSKVAAILESGEERVLWQGQDSTTRAPSDLVVKVDGDIVSKSVKIYIDTARKPGWNEIDAVELVAKDGTRQWASRATASTTYATVVSSSGPGYAKIAYSVPDWRDYVSETDPNVLTFNLNTTERAGAGGRNTVYYQLGARATTLGGYADEGGWQGWR